MKSAFRRTTLRYTSLHHITLWCNSYLINFGLINLFTFYKDELNLPNISIWHTWNSTSGLREYNSFNCDIFWIFMNDQILIEYWNTVNHNNLLLLVIDWLHLHPANNQQDMTFLGEVHNIFSFIFLLTFMCTCFCDCRAFIGYLLPPTDTQLIL